MLTPGWTEHFGKQVCLLQLPAETQLSPTPTNDVLHLDICLIWGRKATSLRNSEDFAHSKSKMFYVFLHWLLYPVPQDTFAHLA